MINYNSSLPQFQYPTSIEQSSIGAFKLNLSNVKVSTCKCERKCPSFDLLMSFFLGAMYKTGLTSPQLMHLIVWILQFEVVSDALRDPSQSWLAEPDTIRGVGEKKAFGVISLTCLITMTLCARPPLPLCKFPVCEDPISQSVGSAKISQAHLLAATKH